MRFHGRGSFPGKGTNLDTVGLALSGRVASGKLSGVKPAANQNMWIGSSSIMSLNKENPKDSNINNPFKKWWVQNRVNEKAVLHVH